MNTILFNPFKFIAGAKSLLIGGLILLLTATIAFYSNTHFPDLISIKGPAMLPFWLILSELLFNCLVFAGVLYLFALFLSSSSIRFIDVLGTQTLARAPYLLAAICGFFYTSVDKFGRHLMYTQLNQGTAVDLSTGDITIAVFIMIFSLLVTIWMVALMFNAFKVATNLKGQRAVFSFVVAFIISMVITFITTKHVILNYL